MKMHIAIDRKNLIIINDCNQRFIAIRYSFSYERCCNLPKQLCGKNHDVTKYIISPTWKMGRRLVRLRANLFRWFKKKFASSTFKPLEITGTAKIVQLYHYGNIQKRPIITWTPRLYGDKPVQDSTLRSETVPTFSYHSMLIIVSFS